MHNYDPVLFDTPMYETANEALLFCKDDLEKRGHRLAAERLEGLAPINAPVLGRLALRALADIRADVGAESQEYVDIAVSSLERALDLQPVRAVA
jgi:hypothetical protein